PSQAAMAKSRRRSQTSRTDARRDLNGAERRCGQLIKEKLDEEGRGRKEVSDMATLSDLGISRDQSSRWQKLPPAGRGRALLTLGRRLSGSHANRTICAADRRANCDPSPDATDRDTTIGPTKTQCRGRYTRQLAAPVHTIGSDHTTMLEPGSRAEQI